MALSIPEILRQFKTDVSKAVSRETITNICTYLCHKCAQTLKPHSSQPTK